MPISPGSAWGEQVATPDQAIFFDTDRQLGLALAQRHIRNSNTTPIVLRGGDTHRVLGLSSTRAPGTKIKIVSDAIAVTFVDVQNIQHQDVCFGSLHIAQTRLRGSLTIITNSGWWKKRDVAPRAHPNDGKLDILEVSEAMSFGQRRQAWQRCRIGSHLPHPLISYSQSDFYQWTGKPTLLTIDGEKLGKVINVSCRVQADCTQLLV